ncbi:MAG: TetR/AcrR family transcriptional regulator [Phormidesmis priestleyi]|uniref:TetR/AcrR family transcriptional regulator n=1 Tax=Phormidesmis priestleyi TaxID=268141 RepID=A0A2W4X8K4_9CYAN|nr:MAG: TetR/AcrR family transcriptional regulator [Phormidesmis priestleyi]
MGRPRKEDSLTQQDVTNAAISCLDESGEAALGVNQVARALGIKPPAIYKHVNGNAGLRQAAAITIWRDYLSHCQSAVASITDPNALFHAGAQAARSYAKSYPARYTVMMQYQMRPSDSEEAEIIQQSLRFFQQSLQLHQLSDDALIDCMRMVNAAIYGFINREQLDLMTLARSSDTSYGVMLDALLVAVAHIRDSSS